MPLAETCTSAPAARSSDTTSGLSLDIARCRGVCPVISCVESACVIVKEYRHNSMAYLVIVFLSQHRQQATHNHSHGEATRDHKVTVFSTLLKASRENTRAKNGYQKESIRTPLHKMAILTCTVQSWMYKHTVSTLVQQTI